MIRFARFALCLAVIAAPAFLSGCNSEEAAKPDATPAVTKPADTAKPDAKKTEAPKDEAKKPDAK